MLFMFLFVLVFGILSYLCLILLPVLLLMFFIKSIKQKKTLFFELETSNKKNSSLGYSLTKEIYEQSGYYKLTGFSYYLVINDKGRYGEYLIYEHLKEYEYQGGKFLFNVYIPKRDGSTSEIDVILIYKNGVFVFESKNLSGKIFGSENDRQWKQILPYFNGYKWISEVNYFYNPIVQNENHIKHLRKYVGLEIPIHSIVCFSERCKLMSIHVKHYNTMVIKRYDVKDVVDKICAENNSIVLNEVQIEEIYNYLLPFVNVEKKVKQQHVCDSAKYKQMFNI